MADHFVVFAGDNIVIGYSNLEHADPSMSIRMGRFRPAAGYAPIETLVQEFSLISFEIGFAQRDPQENHRLQIRLVQLQEKVNALDLRVETRDGSPIETTWIHLVDYAPELGSDEREVTICVVDCDIYSQFFGAEGTQ